MEADMNKQYCSPNYEKFESDAVILAACEKLGGDDILAASSKARDYWNGLTAEHVSAVEQLAWTLTDKDRLCWGIVTLKRPTQMTN
jgi:hypothetical protein